MMESGPEPGKNVDAMIETRFVPWLRMVEFAPLFHSGSRDYHGSGEDYHGDTRDAIVAAREAL